MPISAFTSRTFNTALLLSACLAVSADVMAQGNSQRGQGNGNDARERSNQEQSVAMINLRFEDARRLAQTHNLTGYESLPPGIRKNLARGKPLPPGLARKAVPGPMLESLPVIGGHEWQMAGQDLVLVSLGTQLVVEVLNNVFQ